MSTPTQKTIARLKRQGYVTAIVEKYNTHLKIRQDLYHFIDVIGVGPLGTIAVQTTSASNVSGRLGKITGKTVPKDKKEEDRMLKIRENVIACLSAGWVIEVHGWKKGDLQNPRIETVTFESLTNILDTEDPTNDIPF